MVPTPTPSRAVSRSDIAKRLLDCAGRWAAYGFPRPPVYPVALLLAHGSPARSRGQGRFERSRLAGQQVPARFPVQTVCPTARGSWAPPDRLPLPRNAAGEQHPEETPPADRQLGELLDCLTCTRSW